MGNLTIAMTFVVVLNVLMLFTQVAALNLNPTGSTYYHCKGTMLEAFDKNKCAGDPEMDSESLSGQLPSGEGSVSPTSGNVFIDIFSSIKSWFLDTLGIKYLAAILSGPYNVLKMMQLPSEVAFGLGVIWYAITLIIVIAFFWGRDA